MRSGNDFEVKQSERAQLLMGAVMLVTFAAYAAAILAPFWWPWVVR
jgi:hypothetical protein